jgi:uncharacterized membrane protein required for colicin V production
MPFNWFDLVVVIVLGIGVFRGRQRGMSEELLGVLQWLTIVVVSALAYRPLGRMAAANSDLTLLTANVGAYLLAVLTIKLFFNWLRRMVGEKVVGSEMFGSAEFYLGMVAGPLRFGCVLLMILSLLHAKKVTAEQLAREAKVQKDNFGDISFPTFATVQHDIFQKSVCGKFIGKNLGDQLIQPAVAGEKLVAHESLRARRQREIDEVFGSKK